MQIKSVNSPNIGFGRKSDSNERRSGTSTNQTPPLSFRTTSANLPPSKIATETLVAPYENGEISSIREESVSLEERAAARNRIRKLHGRHYGRSLTLQMDFDPETMFTTKWILAAILVAVLLGGLGVVMLGQSEPKINQRPFKAAKVGKGRKSK